MALKLFLSHSSHLSNFPDGVEFLKKNSISENVVLKLIYTINSLFYEAMRLMDCVLAYVLRVQLQSSSFPGE